VLLYADIALRIFKVWVWEKYIICYSGYLYHISETARNKTYWQRKTIILPATYSFTSQQNKPNPRSVFTALHASVAQNAVSITWTIICDNFETVRNRNGCQLVLITNRKSHTGFRLAPTSVILNDLERRNSPYFAFFTEFDSVAGRLRHSGWRLTYNVRKISSPSSSLPLLAKTNPPGSAVALR